MPGDNTVVFFALLPPSLLKEVQQPVIPDRHSFQTEMPSTHQLSIHSDYWKYRRGQNLFGNRAWLPGMDRRKTKKKIIKMVAYILQATISI